MSAGLLAKIETGPFTFFPLSASFGFPFSSLSGLGGLTALMVAVSDLAGNFLTSATEIFSWWVSDEESLAESSFAAVRVGTARIDLPLGLSSFAVAGIFGIFNGSSTSFGSETGVGSPKSLPSPV